MNREFVTYQESLALKELGFEEECMFNYKQTLLQIELPAPLYQQAFRWFRDKHILTHRISPPYIDVKWDAGIWTIGKYSCIWSDSNFETYEEAEQACLEKLIEIVKNNMI